MPYLGLRGKKLLTAISVTAGVGFCLFGIDNAALGGVISSDPCMSFQSPADFIANNRNFDSQSTVDSTSTLPVKVPSPVPTKLAAFLVPSFSPFSARKLLEE